MKLYQDFDRALLRDVQRTVKRRYPWLDLRSALGVTRSGRTYFVEGYVCGQARSRTRNQLGNTVWTTEPINCAVRWQGRANSAAHAKYQAWSEHLRLMDGANA